MEEASSTTKRRDMETLLYSTNELQVRLSDRDVTYSHIYNGRYEVLDHIFVSNAFNKGNPYHIGYVEYLSLLNDHLIDQTTTDDNVQNRLQSDHGQIVCQIKFYPGLQNPYHRFAQEAQLHPQLIPSQPSTGQKRPSTEYGEGYEDQQEPQQELRQETPEEGKKRTSEAATSVLFAETTKTKVTITKAPNTHHQQKQQEQLEQQVQQQDGAEKKKKKKKKKKKAVQATSV
eukprot:TRINITY_DN495_c0_g1_i2.p1 TRINITY_DN495_c0_g1~~TRINITY_DN495_c0_g1_i2.p1  ORF type:complete len:230 (+),score=50.30 TRINITY_DN495_c0_g1_i2:806-1495(+)